MSLTNKKLVEVAHGAMVEYATATRGDLCWPTFKQLCDGTKIQLEKSLMEIDENTTPSTLAKIWTKLGCGSGWKPRELLTFICVVRAYRNC
jgi:hypothetical protein